MKIIVYKNGEHKEVPAAAVSEYENDPDYLVTIDTENVYLEKAYSGDSSGLAETPKIGLEDLRPATAAIDGPE